MPQPAGNWVVWIWFNLADTPALPEQKSHPSLGSTPDAPCWGAQGFSPVAFPAPFFCNCPHAALPSLSEPGFFHSNHICLKIEYVLVMDAQRGNVCLNEFQRTCNSVPSSKGGRGSENALILLCRRGSCRRVLHFFIIRQGTPLDRRERCVFPHRGV